MAEPQRRTLLKLLSTQDQEPQARIDWQVARNLLGAVPHPRVGLKWQFDWLLWDLEIWTRLSRQERFALYCHFMQFSGGEGLSYGARAIFHVEPNQLTDEQLAEIVEIQFWGWRHYDGHPEHLLSDAHALLARKM